MKNEPGLRFIANAPGSVRGSQVQILSPRQIWDKEVWKTAEYRRLCWRFKLDRFEPHTTSVHRVSILVSILSMWTLRVRGFEPLCPTFMFMASTSKKWAIRPNEAAQRLSVSTKTLQRLRESGEGPEWAKIGGAILYSEKSCTEFLESKGLST